MRAIPVAMIVGLISIPWTSTPADPFPRSDADLNRNCPRAQARHLPRYASFPVPVICEVIDSDIPFPGDIPPPHYQISSRYPGRDPESAPSISPRNETAPSSPPSRSSTARR